MNGIMISVEKHVIQYSTRREEMLITKEANVVTLINVFETNSEQQLIDAWIRFTEEVKEEPGFIGAALHKSTDGARVINYAHWRSESDFGSFLNKYGEQFAQLGRYATRMDPHTYEVVYLYERADS
jgi:heme-degrading monooxygenase HmoA